MYARVNIDECRRCFICRRYCPVHAISILEDYAFVDKLRCVGCGVCINACPLGFIELVEGDEDTVPS